MRCPRCSAFEDRVVDSRAAEEGAAIRRRRECLSCGQRFTTYERLEEAPLHVIKRSGGREPFDRSKIVAGVTAATKNRPVPAEAIEAMAADLEEIFRLDAAEVESARIGAEVLERLRVLDEVAYLRFASVYKDFSAAGDFKREAGLLAADLPTKESPVRSVP